MHFGFNQLSQIIPPLETAKSGPLTVTKPVSMKSVYSFTARECKSVEKNDG